MARELKSVRVDADLLTELERLARSRVVPVTFAEQVDAGLRLLVRQAEDQQARRSAELIAADHDRAEKTYRRLHGRRP